jgi:hypothetical protein
MEKSGKSSTLIGIWAAALGRQRHFHFQGNF